MFIAIASKNSISVCTPPSPPILILDSTTPLFFSSRLYYHQVSANTSGFTAIETDVTTVKIESLLPNTQYIVYATALTYTSANNTNATTPIIVPVKKVESEPSETLVAWTDPAFPAFVEVRMVKSSPKQHTFGSLVSFFSFLFKEEQT